MKNLIVAGLMLATATGSLASQQILWQYKSWSKLHINPLYEAYVKGRHFLMSDYARAKYGPSAKVYLADRTASGWRVRYYRNGWRTTGFRMTDVARWHGRREFGHRLDNWGVYLRRNANRFTAWKGAYIFRLR